MAILRCVLLLAIALVLATAVPAAHADSPGWRRAKNVADKIIYAGHDRTFYCGCRYVPHGDATAGGTVEHTACGYEPPESYAGRATRIEWEHIVPASLMPARQFDCWAVGGRGKCEREDPRAQAMIFDLHNLAPAVGQVNAMRSNDRYAELPDVPAGKFGSCPVKDTRGAFEPPDCLKGDVARVWLYMSFRHGVEIPLEERTMFERWSAQDPVSPWESKRAKRVFDVTFVQNPFVAGATPTAAGACPWE